MFTARFKMISMISEMLQIKRIAPERIFMTLGKKSMILPQTETITMEKINTLHPDSLRRKTGIPLLGIRPVLQKICTEQRMLQEEVPLLEVL